MWERTGGTDRLRLAIQLESSVGLYRQGWTRGQRWKIHGASSFLRHEERIVTYLLECNVSSLLRQHHLVRAPSFHTKSCARTSFTCSLFDF